MGLSNLALALKELIEVVPFTRASHALGHVVPVIFFAVLLFLTKGFN